MKVLISIVGIGPGSREYILPKAVEVLSESQIILGFKRALKSLNFIKKKKYVLKV